MERIWTPWRMEYVKGSDRYEGCIFCDLPAADNDEASLILARSSLAFVIMNKFPYNSGHLMVAPFRHVASYEHLEDPEHAELSRLVAKCMAALRATLSPHGFNIGVNEGTAAGAGIEGHVHCHIVPRWGGDTNFMTTVGEVKVLPEALSVTYTKLAPHFE